MVKGVGPVPCDKMIVGEAPGAEEIKQGVPFVGPSGGLLDKALEEIGRHRSEFYITNVYKLRPENNRDPTRPELSSHLDLLQEEFAVVAPHSVLALGKVARDWLIPDAAGKTISSSREYEWEWEDGTRFNVTYHPSWLLHGNMDSWDMWVDDIRSWAYA